MEAKNQNSAGQENPQTKEGGQAGYSNKPEIQQTEQEDDDMHSERDLDDVDYDELGEGSSEEDSDSDM